jgi:hypothetical protein
MKKKLEEQPEIKGEKEIEKINSPFFNDYSLQILFNTENDKLIDIACKSFVGSTDVPQDSERSFAILGLASDKAQSKDEKREINFYLDYFINTASSKLFKN